MRNYLILLVYFVSCTTTLKSQVNYKGIYSGYPVIFTSENFNDTCKRSITINNIQIPDTFSSTAFIDSTLLHLTRGDSLIININSNCSYSSTQLLNTQPYINPDKAPAPEIVYYDSTGNLVWLYTTIHDSAYFSIQILRWNKWISLGQIATDSAHDLHKYEAKINLHTGENRIRINYWNPKNNKPVSSTQIVIQTPSKEICRYLNKSTKMISFDQETNYEIYDQYGALIKSGRGKFVDITDLPNQMYFYIFYDNQMATFHRR